MPGRIPESEGLGIGRGGTSTRQQGSSGKRDDVKDASPQTLVSVFLDTSYVMLF